MRKIFLIITTFCMQLVAHSQNVGIGTVNPSRAKLEVNGAVDATSAIFGGETAGISLQRNWPGIGYNSYYNNGHRYMSTGFGALQFVDPLNGYMAFDFFNSGIADNLVTSNRLMVISKEGAVHIGSGILPTATLSVARGTSSDGTAALYATNHRSLFNHGNEEHTYIRAGKNNGIVFINDIPGGKVSLNGYVGINTATPEYPLEIRQRTTGNITALAMIEPTNFNYWSYFVSGDGSLGLYFKNSTYGYFNPTNGSYSSTSDKRLKTNITALSTILPKLVQLQPVLYEMKHNNPGHHKSIGFLAQDVKNVFPQLVSVSNDTLSNSPGISDVHGLNYSGFGVFAIKGVQEQQETINSQGNTIAALEKRLARLEDLIKAKAVKSATVNLNCN